MRRAFAHGCVIGYLAPPAKAAHAGKAAAAPAAAAFAPRLNPKDAEVVPAGSQLVFVASSQSVGRTADGEAQVRLGRAGLNWFDILNVSPQRRDLSIYLSHNHPSASPPTLAPHAQPSAPRLRRARGGALKKKHVAVLSFDRDCSAMLEALKNFCPKGSRVTVVTRWGFMAWRWPGLFLPANPGGGCLTTSTHPTDPQPNPNQTPTDPQPNPNCRPPSDPNAKELVKQQLRGLKANAVIGSPASGAVLKQAGLERADAAIICSLSGDPAANDTKVQG